MESGEMKDGLSVGIDASDEQYGCIGCAFLFVAVLMVLGLAALMGWMAHDIYTIMKS